MDFSDNNSLIDLLDDSLRVKLFFARTMSIGVHPFMPMREPVYHALCIQHLGGPVNTIFEDNPDLIVSREKGSVCLLPAGRKRRVEVRNDCDDPVVEIAVAALAFKLFGELDYLSLWDLPVMFDSPTSERLKYCCEKLVSVETDKACPPLEKIAVRQARCWEILELIIANSHLKADAQLRLTSYQSIAPAVKIIERDFRQMLKIEDLACLCSLSRSQFHFNFKRITGSSPLEYQQRLRLTEAKRLLAVSGISVAEVGERLGWTDQFHFSRIFKKTCACSPTDFRKKLRQGFHNY